MSVHPVSPGNQYATHGWKEPDQCYSSAFESRSSSHSKQGRAGDTGVIIGGIKTHRRRIHSAESGNLAARR